MDIIDLSERVLFMKNKFYYLIIIVSLCFIGIDIKAQEIPNGSLSLNYSSDSFILPQPLNENSYNMILNRFTSVPSNTTRERYIERMNYAYNDAKNYFSTNFGSELYDYIIFPSNGFLGNMDIYIFPKNENISVNYVLGPWEYDYTKVGSITSRLHFNNPNNASIYYASFSRNNYLQPNGTNYHIYTENTVIMHSTEHILIRIKDESGNGIITNATNYTLDFNDSTIYKKNIGQYSLFYESTVNIKYVPIQVARGDGGYWIKNAYPKVIINDFEYNNGDVIFTKNNELYQKPSYTFTETIDTSDIATLEVYFKIPQETNFDFDLDLRTFSKGTNVPKPYLTTQSTFEIGDIQQIDSFLEEEIVEQNDIDYTQYSGYFGILFLSQNYVKLTFDFSKYTENYFISFTSNLDFDLVYTTKQEVEEYFVNVDMKDVYGIYFIPKTVDRDVFTPIYLNGFSYNVSLLKDYKNKNEKIDLGLYEKNIFQYQFSFQELNAIIYFESIMDVLEFNTVFITYDSRYFVHQIKENLYDNPTIVNPNTGETVNTGNLDLEGEITEEDKQTSFFAYIERIFSYFTVPILSIFSLITLFFTTLPPELKYLFVGIFILSITYYLIKFIL